MHTMIDITEQPDHSFTKEEVVLLLNQKIEDSVLQQKSIMITIANSLMECRHTIEIDDSEIYEDALHLSSGNFELHIQLGEIKRRYNELQDEFIFTCNNIEVTLYFL